MKQKMKRQGNSLTFKITNTLIRGSLLGDKLDRNGNVKEGFRAIKRCVEKEFHVQVRAFRKQFPNAKLQPGAHKIIDEFSETLNAGMTAKETTSKIRQEIFDGERWIEMIPNKEGKHVEVVSNEEESSWPAWLKWTIAGVSAIVAGVLARLGGYI